MKYDEDDLLDDLPEIDINDVNQKKARGSNARFHNEQTTGIKSRRDRQSYSQSKGNSEKGGRLNKDSINRDRSNHYYEGSHYYSGRTARKAASRTREYTVVTYIFLILFLAMVGYFVYFMSFKSESFIASSYNPRMNALSAKVIRGDIKTSDGQVIATTNVASDGTKTRSYPKGRTYSFVTGYSQKGMSGLEKTQNFKLLTSHTAFLEQLQNDMKGQQSTGDTVVTTVNDTVQEAAYNALGSSKGAIIAMDPSTGKILCMVSKPDYDPNTVVQDWDSISAGEGGSFLNRATQGQYAPGSTFKIVTALEYLREGNSINDTFNCTGSYTYDGYTVSCAGNEVHGRETTMSAFTNSCNVAFSQMGLKLNISDWRKTAKQLLFNTSLPQSLGTSRKSTFALQNGADGAQVMSTAFGQGQTLVSPAHMMLIVSAIANDGVLMKPTLVDSVASADGAVVQHNDVSEYRRLMSLDEAETMRQMLRGVITDGTGRALQTDAYTAYGKTGSAEYETGSKKTHSWFVGYAENGSRSIAIAVIGEGRGYGSSFAVPAAKTVFDAYLK